jgi:hypothetical protein
MTIPTGFFPPLVFSAFALSIGVVALALFFCSAWLGVSIMVTFTCDHHCMQRSYRSILVGLK